jgi:hypothetical protein
LAFTATDEEFAHVGILPVWMFAPAHLDSGYG